MNGLEQTCGGPRYRGQETLNGKRREDRRSGQRTKAMTGPVMQIRHDPSDRWWVAAKWPHGQIEDILGFRTESEANDWIANELDTWLEHRRNEEKADA